MAADTRSNIAFGSRLTSVRPFYIHPLVLYPVPWIVVSFLYSLGWSTVLESDVDVALSTSMLIIVPLILSYFYWAAFGDHAAPEVTWSVDVEGMQRKTKYIFIGWACLSVVEIVASHGLPIIWYMTGSSRVTFDYGITSIHGFVNSMILATVTMRTALSMVTGERKQMTFLVIGIVWALMIVSRNLLIVTVMESVLIFLQCRKIRVFRAFIIAASLFVTIVIVFGLVGDFRTPNFMGSLAGVTPAYPRWLPSGAIWAYLYLTTPLDNLIYTMHNYAPAFDWTFAKTVAQLFPTVVREILFPNLGTQGVLISSTFNVSTAYVGPFQDYGELGYAIFSWVTMGAVVWAWRRRNMMGVLTYAVFGQCAFFSIFYNHFFVLPYLFQLFWFKVCVSEKPVGQQGVTSLAGAETGALVGLPGSG